MKKAEIKSLSDKELHERVDADTVALIQMKINHSITPLDNPAKIKQLRRTIARVKTEIRQRKLQTNN
ncbi:MAG: 50S ribosomal protein L29 [Tannerella sp.]|jgi:large subunit ribosomal protein L29|nr:50S ribosomal protein L29 [Tannerella sp.]